jgi:hypothetical protein
VLDAEELLTVKRGEYLAPSMANMGEHLPGGRRHGACLVERHRARRNVDLEDVVARRPHEAVVEVDDQPEAGDLCELAADGGGFVVAEAGLAAGLVLSPRRRAVLQLAPTGGEEARACDHDGKA